MSPRKQQQQQRLSGAAAAAVTAGGGSFSSSSGSRQSLCVGHTRSSAWLHALREYGWCLVVLRAQQTANRLCTQSRTRGASMGQRVVAAADVTAVVLCRGSSRGHCCCCCCCFPNRKSALMLQVVQLPHDRRGRAALDHAHLQCRSDTYCAACGNLRGGIGARFTARLRVPAWHCLHTELCTKSSTAAHVG
jgi:hypothetical protein